MRDWQDTTGREVAITHGLTSWPHACPWCGDRTLDGRTLQPEPGRRGQARYRCGACGTTFQRSAFEVGQVVVAGMR